MKKFLFILFFPVLLFATDNYWTALITGDYGNALNWSLISVPNGTVNAFFTNIVGEVVTVSANQQCSNMNITQVSQTLTLDIQDSFSMLVTNQIFIGNASGQNSTLLLNDTGNLKVPQGFVRIGNVTGAIGRMIVSNGNVSCTNMLIGNQARSMGTYEQYGGTNNIFASLTCANGGNATGNVLLVNGLLMLSNGASFGSVGYSTVTQSNGTMIALQEVDVGANALGTGTLNMYGGTNRINHIFRIGNSATSTGLMLMAGGQFEVTNNFFVVGSSGMGTLNQTMGLILSSNQTFIVANAAKSTGIYTLSGGTNITTTTFTIGSSANSTGTVTMVGGILNVTNNTINVANNGIALMTVSNGAIFLGKTFDVGLGVNGTGRLDINGGTINIADGFFSGTNATTKGTASVLLQNAAILTTTTGVNIGQLSPVTVSNGNNQITGPLVLRSNAEIVGSLIVK